MELTLLTSQLAVYDDVLPEDAFARLGAYIESEDYQYMQEGQIQGYFRPEDGRPIHRKRGFAWLAVPLNTLVPREDQAAEVRRGLDLYPTKSPLDAVFEAARAKALEHKDLVGEEKTTWVAITGKIYIYLANTGLSWHWDHDIFSGAYIYYAHPEWNAQWGGELLVGDAACVELKQQIIADRNKGDPSRTLYRRKQFFGTRTNGDDAILKRGFGHFIMAKPNRLVLLKGNQPHKLSLVSHAAGNHGRMSFTGFFATRAGIAQLLGSKGAT
jgi:hypothetical protein